MIILPTTTPVATTDYANLNQSGQQQANLAEESRKANDTVQFSFRSLELASAQLHNRPTPSIQPAATQGAADNEAREVVADNEAVESNVRVNAQTQKPEATKIDVLA